VKIAYITAGAGGMYCGACLHDNTLARALTALGEEVLLVPTYTPLRTDEEDVSHRRIFYGGVNVFLQQKSSIFRHTPGWFDRWFDSPALLGALARRAATTDAHVLGQLTVSVLRGEDGNQKKELDKLVRWLETDVQPDIVHLSNALLAGFARELRRRLNVPVVCGLSGEDVFIDRIPDPHRESVCALLAERAGEAQAYVSLNAYYADYMATTFGLDRDRMHVIPHGVDLEGYATGATRRKDDTVALGYFARICQDKGLHLLVDAFIRLSKEPSLPPLSLQVAGYLSQPDREYLKTQEQKLAGAGLADRYKYHGELDRPAKIAFLRSIDIFSVPTVYRESKGLPVVEAWASGVPVVAPDHGSFAELVSDTGGGLLCRPNDAEDLAEKLTELVRNPALAAQLGERGEAAIRDRYQARHMAAATRTLYESLLKPEQSDGSPTAAPPAERAAEQCRSSD